MISQSHTEPANAISYISKRSGIRCIKVDLKEYNILTEIYTSKNVCYSKIFWYRVKLMYEYDDKAFKYAGYTTG